jgi:hypothetical protein
MAFYLNSVDQDNAEKCVATDSQPRDSPALALC